MVTQNFLEIHLFWASKGTTIVPDRTTYGPIVSALSATPSKKKTSIDDHTHYLIN